MAQNNTGDYRGTGTEPLRSDPKSLNGSVTPSPSASAKDAGGTENLKAQTQTFQAAWKQSGAGTTHFPGGVQNFTDDKV